MPQGRYKSGRFRKVFVKAPSGRVHVHYKERKPKKAHCATCRKELLGVPRERPVTMVNIPKTAKRPQRPHGGVLCASCSRKVLKQTVRNL